MFDVGSAGGGINTVQAEINKKLHFLADTRMKATPVTVSYLLCFRQPEVEHSFLLLHSPGEAGAHLAAWCPWGADAQCSLCAGRLCREREVRDVSSCEDGAAHGTAAPFPLAPRRVPGHAGTPVVLLHR